MKDVEVMRMIIGAAAFFLVVLRCEEEQPAAGSSCRILQQADRTRKMEVEQGEDKAEQQEEQLLGG